MMKNRKIFLPFFVFAFLSPLLASAQQHLTLSVSPPIIDLTARVGESWPSSIKVVNANPYDLNLYATVVNFKTTGEEGKNSFIPILDDENINSLAQWIDVSDQSIFVSKDSSVNLPFSVNIPEDAPPGEHRAAILIGTQPFNAKEGGSTIQVSSFVSTLLFVKAKGDVRENGFIKEFSTNKSFYENPDVQFTLRFENNGNVHLSPKGNITVYNLWGKKRGVVEIAEENVLPDSIRKLVFRWQDDNNILEAGRHKAIVTLDYGSKVNRRVTNTIYFWVLPKRALILLSALVVLVLLSITLTRFFVKRAVHREIRK